MTPVVNQGCTTVYCLVVNGGISLSQLLRGVEGREERNRRRWFGLEFLGKGVCVIIQP